MGEYIDHGLLPGRNTDVVGRLGWREWGVGGRLIDRDHSVAPLNVCFVQGPSITRGVSAHGVSEGLPKKPAGMRGAPPIRLSHLLAMPPVFPLGNIHSRKGPHSALHGCQKIGMKDVKLSMFLIYILKDPLVMYACSNATLCRSPTRDLCMYCRITKKHKTTVRLTAN